MSYLVSSHCILINNFELYISSTMNVNYEKLIKQCTLIFTVRNEKIFIGLQSWGAEYWNVVGSSLLFSRSDFREKKGCSYFLYFLPNEFLKDPN